ncbi:DUF1336 domain containing protein [Nitzschia inconspicua]|uniref:DUF1336 domain containing protein n=1 Tax=Nitzschia inconspicua TaxID=303405 RepID=A0A9K3K7U6_9STRA|nr:DUF1336 domain containing protein [Nitzschia inconspicua]KAG7342686.1 DUF1336 domain containing protein [Nitzschia inconspicua]
MESLSRLGRQSYYESWMEMMQHQEYDVTRQLPFPPSSSVLESSREMIGNLLDRISRSSSNPYHHHHHLQDTQQEMMADTDGWIHDGHGTVTSSVSESSSSSPDPTFPLLDYMDESSNGNIDGTFLSQPQPPPLTPPTQNFEGMFQSILSPFQTFSLPLYQPNKESDSFEFLRYNLKYIQTILQQIGTNTLSLGRRDQTDPTWAHLVFLAVAVLLLSRIVRWSWRKIRSTGGTDSTITTTTAAVPGPTVARRRLSSGVMHASGRSLTFQQQSGAIVDEGPFLQNKRQSSFRGIEILRSGVRGRFGTFDFFGMNDTAAARRRTPSTDDSYGELMDSATLHDMGGRRSRHNSRSGPSGPPTGGSSATGTGSFRKERLGSMDVYLADGALGGMNNRKNTDLTPSSSNGLGFPGEAYLTSSAIIDDDDGERYLYDEFGIVTLSHRVEYYGPSRSAFDSTTFIPPKSWEEASRRIIPTMIMTKLERRLRLDTLVGKLTITTPKSTGQNDTELPLDEISIYAHRPLEGGVFSLYVKGAPKEEWMEHTFNSARAAAQFQLDLTAYQVLGKTLKHIFEALNMIHQGSFAYDGPEFVFHNDHRDGIDEKNDNGQRQPPKSINATRCVAWDDAMRALSSIPTVRIALERLWLSHRRPSEITSAFARKPKKEKSSRDDLDARKTEKDESNLDIITEEYSKKRLLLGPLDFFRLFVPSLPDTAVPEGDSNRGRMEQLLSWRKRVARAAVLVRAYTRARRLVNLGWNLHSEKSGESTDETITKRLAYDGNEDNNTRDTAAKNEIYEASVSRDVLCYVRPYDFLTLNRKEQAENLVLSPYQAYSHIGTHYFKIPSQVTAADKEFCSSRDPVEMFPTLRKIISQNPDLDFLILGLRLHTQSAIKFELYVRSFPKSIDPQFDCVVDRFINGTQDFRDRKLHIMIQLGNRMGLSYADWLLLWILSLLFQLTGTGRNMPINLETTRDRYAFPTFKVASFFRTTHFGGSMHTTADLPKNYVAAVSEISTDFLPNLIPRMIFSQLHKHMSDSIVDVTYFLEGDKEDELPERALCTIRQVRINPDKLGMDLLHHVSTLESLDHNSLNAVALNIDSPTGEKSTENGMGDFSAGNSNDLERISDCTQGRGADQDPVRQAVDSVLEILEKVEVPARVKSEDVDTTYPENMTEETGSVVIKMVPVVKMFGRYDIERFVRECDFEIKDAAVRLVQTAAWRGRTFPLDKRRMRIELQNGQFFHQGFDLNKDPVFYFRNMCKGPWRGDPDAVVSAVLYRFEQTLSNLATSHPFCKATLIILMGVPKKSMASEIGQSEDESTLGDDETNKEGADVSTVVPSNHKNSQDTAATTSVTETDNPRISKDEHWKCHTNSEAVEKLYHVLSTYYPARLSKVLIVKGRGKNTYYGTNLEGRIKLKKAVDSQHIRDKIKFVNKTSELTNYVAMEELCIIVGGKAPVSMSSFVV